MKPTFRFIIAAMAAVSMFASCRKAVETAVPEAGDSPAGSLRVTGRMAEVETKTQFSKEESNLIPAWKVGDEIIGLWGTDKAVIWKVKELPENDVVFAYVSGTEPWENGTEVSVIYAPGKGIADIQGTGSGRTLEFDLSNQAGTLASLGNHSLMTGRGTVSGSNLPLTFNHSIAVLSLDKLKDLTADAGPYSVSIESDSLSNCGTFGFGSDGALTFTGGQKGKISTGATFTSNGSGELDSVFFAVPAAHLTEVAVSVTKGTETLNYNLPVNREIMPGRYYYKTALQSEFDITANGTENTGVYTVDGGTYIIQSGDPLADVKKAKEGELITVTSSPETGYELVSIKWKEEGGSETDITEAKTFTMPTKAVTVTVTFKKVYSFTVDGSNTKVVFAPGNLYAKKDGGNWTWGFYDKQYKFHFDSMTKISASGGSRTADAGDTEIDLFTWGYDNNPSSGSYSLNPVNSAGISGHDMSDGNYNFSDGEDWGSIAPSPAPYSGGWRTLSKNEWVYLLNIRTGIGTVSGTANARYLKCKVKDGAIDVYGLMIFPDAFTWPTTVTAPTASYVNDNDLAWNSVPEYNETQFTALAEAGVVFLPAAGRRGNSSVITVGSVGGYWSSSAQSSIDACILYFSGSYVKPYDYFNRSYGRSVRLVSVVQ